MDMMDSSPALSLVPIADATHTAQTSGDWSDPATWGGSLPGIGARVVIPDGVTVTVDGDIAAEIKTIRVDGTLRFATDVDTTLRVDTLVTTMGSRLEIGTADDPVQADVTARVIFADDGAIDTTWDPAQLSRGALLHGTTEIHGAEKTAHSTVADFPLTGATQLTLSSAPTGWQVGDTIVIAGTDAADPASDEVVTITAIDGATIHFDTPLARDHAAPRDDLQVHVANLTRNVQFSSENAEAEHRGHLMVMHTNDASISYAAFDDMGRSDKVLGYNDHEFVDLNPFIDPIDLGGDNVRGRYSVHFHKGGTDADSTPGKVHGSVVTDEVGWGFVNHSSHVEFTGNVTHNIPGAAFFTEAGDEIGAFIGNLAIRTVNPDMPLLGGEELDPDAREARQDYGFQGDGFWFHGPNVRVEDNVVSGASGHAYIWWPEGLLEKTADGGTQKVFHDAANVPNGDLIGPDGTRMQIMDVPIGSFIGNQGYATTKGVQIFYLHTEFFGDDLHTEDGTIDPPEAYDAQLRSTLSNTTIWNVLQSGFAAPYANRLSIDNLRLVGTGAEGTVGLDLSHFLNNIGLEVTDLTVEGFDVGFRVTTDGEVTVTGSSFDGNGTDIQNIIPDEDGGRDAETGELIIPFGLDEREGDEDDFEDDEDFDDEEDDFEDDEDDDLDDDEDEESDDDENEDDLDEDEEEDSEDDEDDDLEDDEDDDLEDDEDEDLDDEEEEDPEDDEDEDLDDDEDDDPEDDEDDDLDDDEDDDSEDDEDDDLDDDEDDDLEDDEDEDSEDDEDDDLEDDEDDEDDDLDDDEDDDLEDDEDDDLDDDEDDDLDDDEDDDLEDDEDEDLEDDEDDDLDDDEDDDLEDDEDEDLEDDEDEDLDDDEDEDLDDDEDDDSEDDEDDDLEDDEDEDLHDDPDGDLEDDEDEDPDDDEDEDLDDDEDEDSDGDEDEDSEDDEDEDLEDDDLGDDEDDDSDEDDDQSDDNEDDTHDGAQLPLVAFLGDSITESGFPEVLDADMSETDVRNFGVSSAGVTAAAEILISETDVYEELLTETEPDVVWVMFGGNDLAGTQDGDFEDGEGFVPPTPEDLDAFEAGLRAVVADLQELDCAPEIVLASPTPFSAFSAEADAAFRALYIPVIAAVAEDLGLSFVDIHQMVTDYPDNYPDLLHPDEAGNATLAALIAPFVEAALEDADPAPEPVDDVAPDAPLWMVLEDDDTLVFGGTGTDMLSFANRADHGDRAPGQFRFEIDLENGLARDPDGQMAVDFEGFENVTGSIYTDLLRGDDGDNRMRGLGDYDWFIATEGNDTYDGGTGNDMISFLEWEGTGAATRGFFDQILPSEEDALAGVRVDLSDAANNTGLAEGKVLISVERVTGSSFQDVFVGDDGSNNLRGMGGYDWFVASDGGRERYFGGNGLDTVTYHLAPDAITASLINGTPMDGAETGYGSAGWARKDLYFSIENLVGSAFDDSLEGSSGKNQLSGLDGDDLIFGMGGSDQLKGGAGDDTLDGGAGSDRAIFDGLLEDYEITRTAAKTAVVSHAQDGTDTTIDIEYFQFDDQTVDIWSLDIV